MTQRRSVSGGAGFDGNGTRRPSGERSHASSRRASRPSQHTGQEHASRTRASSGEQAHRADAAHSSQHSQQHARPHQRPVSRPQATAADYSRANASRYTSGRSSRPAQKVQRQQQEARRQHNHQQQVRMQQARQMQSAQHLSGGPQRSKKPFIIGAIAVVALALIAVLIINPFNYKVTINGEECTVKHGATIADALEAGYATPTPGNLLDVEGELLEKGAGDTFAATVNGEATNDPETTLPKDAVVEITDGADATEEFESSEEVITHGQSTAGTDQDSYFAHALHVYSDGEDGTQVTKTGKVSGKTVTEVTKPARDAGYTVYTADTGGEKVIALTFDDGPWPETTGQILDVLEANNAKATFFTIGNQISEHPDEVKRAVSIGCEVVTHTWDHADGSGQGVNLTYMSPDEQVQEVQKGYAAIKEVTGEEPPHILRAPGGNYYGDLITTLQPYVDAEVGWEVDTEDWRLPGVDAIVERIMSVEPGQVILMHDGGGDRSQSVAAVQQAVPELVKQGYKLVTVSELLQYPPQGETTTEEQ